MAALTQARALSVDSWTYHQFTLASGEIAYKGGLAAFNATGELEAGAVSTAQVAIGTFAEDVDASSAASTVNVRLAKEVHIVWFANSGSDAVDAADIGGTVYIEDDQTVSATDGAGSRSAAGRCWAVEADRGVAVQIAL